MALTVGVGTVMDAKEVRDFLHCPKVQIISYETLYYTVIYCMLYVLDMVRLTILNQYSNMGTC